MGNKSLMKLFTAVLLPMCLLSCTRSSGPEASSSASNLSRSANSELEGGHEHGNGGDDLSYSNVAWFAQSNREVKYCVQVNEEFPLNDGQIATEIQSAIATWKSFLESVKYTMYSTSVMSQRFTRSSNCAEADLIFHVGSQKPVAARSELGAALRQSFDAKTNWGSGEIWISLSGANWKEKFRLQGALLHLLGEVMGFGAVSGTIMDPAWEAWAVASTSPGVIEKLTRIEGNRRIAGSLAIFRDSVRLAPQVQSVLGLTNSGNTAGVDVEVNFNQLILKVQGRDYRFVSTYSRKFKRGFSHKVVYFDTQAPYRFMRTTPRFLSQDDATYIHILKFLDLPGKPQMILELNGDRAISLTPMGSAL